MVYWADDNHLLREQKRLDAISTRASKHLSMRAQLMERKELGKIKSIRYGFGGRDDAMFGLTVELGGESWGTTYFHGTWARTKIEKPANAEWSEADRLNSYVSTTNRIENLLRDANVRDIKELIGKPIEATFSDNLLKEWRILTEVI